MKRTLILTLLFILSTTAGECAATFFPPLQPVEQASNTIQDNTLSSMGLDNSFSNPVNNDYSAIGRIEQSLFGRIYTNQNITARLSRIEKSLFTTTYPNVPYPQRIDNIISNFNQINKYPNISKNVLSRMESRIFNQNFSENTPQKRIENLEEEIFGAVQSGDLDSRYKALQLAYKNCNKNNAYLPNTAANSGWKGILGSMGDSLFGGGTMTGFTPPINPYNYGNGNGYNSYAGQYPSGSGTYRSSGTNRGLNGFSYNDSLNNYGSSTGVTILD